MFDEPRPRHDFGGGRATTPAQAPPSGPRWQVARVPQVADAQTLPPLAAGDVIYWLVLVLGACFLFSRRRPARPE